jgi:hypothetical protein
MASTGYDVSVYGAEEALLDLADTYLQPGSYSTLKSGFLGYMTGSMARVAAEGVHHRNTLYHENFLNTASLPRSIYNYAKIYDYPIALATPSSCRVLVGFYLDEIKAALGAETGILKLPRGQAIYLGTTPFVLAGSVSLAIMEQGRVAAEYSLAEMDFPEINQAEYVRTYVTPQVVDVAGTLRTVVYLEVRIHQATPAVSEFRVVSSSSLETSFYKVTIPDGQQLTKFRVLYKKPADSGYVELPAYFNETVTPDESEYCFYSFSTTNELEIYFSPLPGAFRPAYNSALRVEFLTTEGVSGNFDFTGTPVMTVNGQSLTTLVEMVTQPAGGYNAETLMEVKRGILRKILERRNIIIETDLSNYLNGAVDRTQVNNSLMTFIKRRDDIQTRLFAAYLMVRDSAGRIVPTNTASLDFEVADLAARGWSLPAGTLIVYDRRNSMYRLIAPGEYPDKMAADPNSFVYCVPFLMQFRTQPFPRLVYYRNQISLDAALSSLPGATVSADSFLANSVTVRRNSAFESSYQIDLPISSNLAADGLAAKCLVRVRFLDTSGRSLGYAEAVPLDGTNIFRAVISTNDAFDETSKMLFTDSIWSDGDTLTAATALPEEIRLKFELYYDSSDPRTDVQHVVRGDRVFQLTNVFQTIDPLSLYKSLERVMSSGMYVTTEGTFHCDGVPLVGASFFLNPRVGQEAMGVVEKYHSAIFDIFDLLHNNTSVDVKLYNTYGPSKLYNLDRINTSLVLQVRPRNRASEELRQAVIQAAAQFVQTCNDNDNGRFSISNLTTHIENTILDVAFVRFVSLNGVAAQNAEMIYSANVLMQDNKRIPEYINVATVLRSTLDADPYVPDVQVEFI